MLYLRGIRNFAYHEDDTVTFTYFHLTTKDIMQFLLQVARCEKPGRNISMKFKRFFAFYICKIGINDEPIIIELSLIDYAEAIQ